MMQRGCTCVHCLSSGWQRDHPGAPAANSPPCLVLLSPACRAVPAVQAGESDKRLETKLGAEAAAFAALDPEAAATQMPRLQVSGVAGGAVLG